MLCPQCGTENQDSNRYCTNCNYDFSTNMGNQPNQQPNGWQANPNTVNNYPVYQKPFHSHLAMSIVAIFLFTILGIIATVMSSQATNAYKFGDFAQAERKAKTAMILSIISYIVGSLLIIGKLCLLAL